MVVGVDLFSCMLWDDVACLHIERNRLTWASYLYIENCFMDFLFNYSFLLSLLIFYFVSEMHALLQAVVRNYVHHGDS